MIDTTVVAVVGEKGGTAKSTTAFEVAAGLTGLGSKTLCVDFDPQGSLSEISRCDNTDAMNVLNVLHGDCSVQDAVQHGAYFDIITANNSLSEVESFVALGKDTMRDMLAPLRGSYDYIVIDMSPMPKTRSVVTVVSAADRIVLPILAEPQPARSLAKTARAIAKIDPAAIPRTAVLITRHFPYYNVYRGYGETIARFCQQAGIRLFRSFVRNSVSVPEAQDKGVSLSDYKRFSAVAADYRNVAQELAEWCKGGDK